MQFNKTSKNINYVFLLKEIQLYKCQNYLQQDHFDQVFSDFVKFRNLQVADVQQCNIYFINRVNCLEPPNTKNSCTKCSMNDRITKAGDKCYSCTNNYSYINFPDGVKKCCPKTCKCNCTEKTRLNNISCADCSDGQVYDDDNSKCISLSSCLGVIKYGICYQSVSNVQSDEVIYDPIRGELVKIVCDSTCSTCSNSPNICKSCFADNYFIGETQNCGKCDTSNGYYIENGRCNKCDSICKLCQDSSKKCDKCIDDGKYKDSITLICGDCDQFSSRFIDGEMWKQCDQYCQICENQSQNCIKCSQSYYFIGNSQICGKCDISNGWYIDGDRCNKCDSMCQTCEKSNVQLQKCQNYFQQYYYDQISSDIVQFRNLQVADVQTNCLEPPNTMNSCTRCSMNDRITAKGDKCYSCTNNYNYINFPDGVKKCCPINCKNCTEKTRRNKNSCADCSDGQVYDDDNSKCISLSSCSGVTKYGICYQSIPNTQSDEVTYDPIKGNLVKIVCDSTCLTCSNSPNICKSCPTGNYLIGDTQKYRCKKCNEVCKVCSDSSQKCHKCIDGKFKDPITLICGDCDLSSSKFIEGEMCKQCDQYCQNCEKQSQNCIKCSQNYYFIGNSQICGKCDTSNGWYIDGDRCNKCDSMCLTCEKSKLQLQRCENYFQQDYYDQFPSGIVKFRSLQADAQTNCLEPPNTQNSCTRCSMNDRVTNKGDKCYNCGSNYQYQNFPDGVKKCCPSQCKNCTEKSRRNKNSCADCSDGQVYDDDNSKCISLSSCQGVVKYGICYQSIPNAQSDEVTYDQIKGDLVKIVCDSNCLTCSNSPNICKSCPAGNYLIGDPQKCGKCDTSNGYYIDNGRCKKCDSICKLCKDSSQKCDKCIDGKYKDSTTQICGDCDLNSQKFIDGDQCKSCDATCLTCEKSSQNCTKCPNGKYFNGDTQNCGDCDISNGYYVDNGRCRKCDTVCKICKDSTQKCDKCIDGKYKDSTTLICGDCNLNSQKFIDGDQCKSCDSSCQTCEKSSQNCTKCPNGKYFIGDTQNCGDCDISNGYYVDYGRCRKCDSVCKICKDSTQKCDKCIDGKYKDSTTLICGDCILNSQKFIDGDQCKSCDATCLTCEISSKNCTKCSNGNYFIGDTQNCGDCDISNGYYIDNDSTQKCDKCIDGKYKDSTTLICGDCDLNSQKFIDGDQCKSCDATCLTCEKSSQNCTKCSNGKYFIGETQNCGDCDISNGYYVDNGRCRKCDSVCKICKDSTQKCDKCIDSQYKDSTTLICGDCDKNQQKFIDGDQCKSCDATCQTCEISSKNCTKCSNGKYFIGDTQNCGVCDISNGNYIDNGRCRKCDSVCTTCSDSSQKCDKCIDGKYKDSATLICGDCDLNSQKFIDGNQYSTQKCDICVDGKYKDAATQICGDCDKNQQKFIDGDQCKSCHVTCQTCSGLNDNQCLTCIKDKYKKDSKCQDCDTKNGYFIKGDQCLECSQDCMQCSGAENNECNQCMDEKYLHDDFSCKPCNLEQGFFIDAFSCKKCHNKCKTCSGPLESDCNNCPENTYFQGETKVCGPCDLKNKKFIKNNKCQDCHTNCQTCSDEKETSCTTCIDTLFKYQVTQNCIPCNQADKQFRKDQFCLDCDLSCSTCQNQSNECITCAENYSFKPNSKECIKCNQSDKQFVDKDNVCQSCFKNCQTCNGLTENDCITCIEKYYFSLKSKQCVQCDLENKQYLTDDKKCDDCSEKCLTCSGPNKDNCLTCVKDTYFQEDTNECGECKIDNKQYLDNQNKCRKCHESCKTCSASDEFSCTICDTDKFFQKTQDNKKQCVKCGEKHFVDKADNFCKICSKNCLNCVGENEDQCTQCDNNTYFQEDTQKCVECDPKNKPEFIDKTDPNKLKCRQCSPSCQSCELFGANNCTKCKYDLYFNEAKECQKCEIENGFYIVGDQCKKCDSTCKKCNGPTADDCINCPEKTYFQEDTKKCDSCDLNNGFFIDDQQRCRKCHDFCLVCNDKTPKCQKCKDGFNFRNGECIKCDQQGFFIDKTDNNLCKKCHFSCKQCDGEADDMCLECYEPQIFEQNSKKCVNCNKENSVFTQNGADGVKRCFPCHTSCQKCTGQDGTNCTECTKGLSFLDGKCQECKDDAKYTKYIDDKNNCINCPENCQNCDKTGCNQCKIGFYFKEGISQCQQCDTDNKYFVDNDNKLCRQCDTNCQTCNGLGPNKCTSCADSKFYLQVDNSCGLCDTTKNYYKDESQKKCLKCHQDCKTCSDGKDTSCIECLDPQTYKDKLNRCQKCHEDCDSCEGPNQNECKKCKLANKFISISDKTCQPCQSNQTNDGVRCKPCPQNCQKCSYNETKQTCETCLPGFPLKSDGQCGTCGESEYPDPITNTCKQCHSSCLSCTGPGDTECTKCKDTSLRIRLDNNKCGTCESNQFSDQIKCLKCSEYCQTCSGPNKDQCQSCVSDYYFNGNTNECIKCNIDEKFFIDGTKCRSCDISCQTCSGQQEDQCLKCPNGSSFIGTPIKDKGGKCQICDTKNGKYKDEETNSCLDCNSACKTCSGPTGKDCEKCKDGLYKRSDLGNICQICNEESGFYTDKPNQECKACDSSCLKCSGPQNNQCTECKNDDKLNEQNMCKPCDTSSNYYIDGIYCKKCHSDCKTCKGGNQNECKQCVYDRYFFNNDHICKQCHQDCSTCNGETQFDCQKCFKNGYYLSTGQQKKCVQCDFNQYNDGTNCQNCIANCLSCDNGTQCKKCEKNYPKTKGGICGKCENNEFVDSQNECKSCHTDCSSCTGPSQNQCIKCLNANKFIRTDTKICGDCDLNQYGEDSVCKSCHKDCSECSGPSDLECKKCSVATNYNCQDNEVKNFINGSSVKLASGVNFKCQKSCLKCHENCETCFGEGVNQCMKCKVGILQDDLSCSKKCPKGSFFDESNIKCSKCSENCSECTGLNQCQICQPDYTLLEGQCYKCDIGQYLDKIQKSCKPCHESCKSCNESTERDCIECKNSDYFFDQNNICVNKCQDGFIKNPKIKRCQQCAYKITNGEKQCVVDCGSGQYVNLNTRICEYCFKNCLECKNAITCDKCEEGLSFIDDKRSICQKCPVKYYSDPSTNICVQCNQNNCDYCQTDRCLKCSHEYTLNTDRITCKFDERYKYYSCNSKEEEDCEKEIDVINKTDVSMKSVQVTSTAIQAGSSVVLVSAATFGYTLQIQQLIGNFVVCDDLKQISLGPTFLGQYFSMNIINLFPSPLQSLDEEPVEDNSNKNDGSNQQNQQLKNKRALSEDVLLENDLKIIHSKNFSKQFIKNVIVYIFLLVGLLLVLKTITIISKKITFFSKYCEKKYSYLIWFNQIFSNFIFASIFKGFFYINFTHWLNIVSFVLQVIFVLAYVFFLFVLIRKVRNFDPRYLDREEVPKIQYLVQNISVMSAFQKYFWFIFEARKILNLALLFLVPNKMISCSFILIINLFFTIYLIYWKPFTIKHQLRYYIIIEVLNTWISILIFLVITTHYKLISWLALGSLWVLNAVILIYAVFTIIYTMHIIYCKKRFIVKTSYYYEDDIKMQKFRKELKMKHSMQLQNLSMTGEMGMPISSQSLEYQTDRSINYNVVEQLDDIQKLSIKWNLNPIYARQIALQEVSGQRKQANDITKKSKK
ncbi:hypothetical protein ABPG73_001250 [Tetrahymena malaccensis]